MEALYQPDKLEPEIQQQWQTQKTFNVKEDLSKEKFYCLAMFPYPSGHLHMGHVRNYTLGDAISRYQRMLGKNVLQPMGWDAFGLPAENAAIKNKVAPGKWTHKNIAQMRKQFQRLGFGYDWSREITTCEPDYYRWEQWFFLKLYQKGLVYRKAAVVNWDPVDKTVLANEQVIDGRGWRSGALIERQEIPQWFLKITDYADELLNDIDKLDGWPEQVKIMQRNWIGRSRGVEIKFAVEDELKPIEVFTTRPDTIMGVSYLAISPQHPLALAAAMADPNVNTFVEKCKNIKVAEATLATMEKEGVYAGFDAIHPISGAKIPVWIANFVVMDYGTGAVMSVPAHDVRDHEFAKKYKLPIKQVIKPLDNTKCNVKEAAFTDKGMLTNSGDFNKLNFDEAFTAITEKLKADDNGAERINYRLRDWGVSRQRYWGTPIPIIYCKDCGTVPVPEADLPVTLPDIGEFTEFGSPLSQNDAFINCTCPKCGGNAKRETDTFDTFMESSWYYARFACPDAKDAMLDERVKYWTPVDQYIGGIEHAVMHLLYARFFHKLMRDEGLVNSDEPFKRLLSQGMVNKDGAKMSKSKGNTVNPKTYIEKFGADTIRLFMAFAAPPEQALEWSDSGVEGCYRFLKRIWTFAHEQQALISNVNKSKTAKADTNWQSANDDIKEFRRQKNEILKQALFDYERQQFNTVVSGCMKLMNLLAKSDIDNATLISECFSVTLRLLSPLAPHITQHLWHSLGYGKNILSAQWPNVDETALKQEKLTMIIQVNGKLRGKLSVAADTDQEQIKLAAQQDEKVSGFLADKTINKVILVPGKLVNFVVSD